MTFVKKPAASPGWPPAQLVNFVQPPFGVIRFGDVDVEGELQPRGDHIPTTISSSDGLALGCGNSPPP